jgi:drug/metabolite transporter (DMT)-like permease
MLIIIGIVGSGAPAFLFAWAQTGIDSSLAGILNSLTPLFTMIIGVAFFHLKIRWFNVFCVFIAQTGAIGLLHISGGQSFEFNLGYAIFIIIATICYATNVNLVKYYLKHLDALTITIFSFFAIGLPVMVYLFFFTDFLSVNMQQPGAYIGLGYVSVLAVVGTALALIIFNKLIKVASPVFAASVTYMIPIVAVIWGILDGELFKWQFVAWIVLILTGVFLVNYNKRHDKRSTRIR